MAETDLIDIPTEKAFDVFTKPNGVEPYIEIVRKAVNGFVPSVETEADRAEVKSTAFRVIRSATYLEKVGKAVAAEQKKIPAIIDAARRHADTELRAIAERIRAPLTAWETEEKARKDRHLAAIDRLGEWQTKKWESAEAIRADIAVAQAVEVSPEVCEEFEDEYRLAKGKAVDALRMALAVREKHDADQAELARLRAAEEQRKAAEAETLRLQQVKEQQEAAEADRQRREAEAVRAAEQRARDEERAEAQRREDALKAAAAKREAEIAQAEADRQRLENERAADRERERAAEERRQANRRHQASVNNRAVEALQKLIAEEIIQQKPPVEHVGYDCTGLAKAIVVAIAKQKIPQIQMVY